LLRIELELDGCDADDLDLVLRQGAECLLHLERLEVAEQEADTRGAADNSFEGVDQPADREVRALEGVDDLSVPKEQGEIIFGDGEALFEDALEFGLPDKFGDQRGIANQEGLAGHGHVLS